MLEALLLRQMTIQIEPSFSWRAAYDREVVRMSFGPSTDRVVLPFTSTKLTVFPSPFDRYSKLSHPSWPQERLLHCAEIMTEVL